MPPERHMLIDQLILHEGIRLKPYVDPAGNVTIGVGRNLTGKGISSREAMELLDHDLDECVSDLAGDFPWFVRLDGCRQRATVDLRFNLGPTGFRTFKRFLGAMARGDYAKAASELRASNWFRQVQASRSARLIHMIATGTDL